MNPSSHSQSDSLCLSPCKPCFFACVEKLKVGAAVIWRGSVLALPLCGPFTPNPATDDITGRREVDGFHVPEIPTFANNYCFSLNLHAAPTQGLCGA